MKNRNLLSTKLLTVLMVISMITCLAGCGHDDGKDDHIFYDDPSQEFEYAKNAHTYINEVQRIAMKCGVYIGFTLSEEFNDDAS